MKIDQLPVEMLMKIFTFIPSFKELSLVNKYFYDVACKMNDSNICLSLDYRLFKEERLGLLLEGIRNTNRKITNVRILSEHLTETQLRSSISVIKKFTATIKCLSFDVNTLKMSYFLEILSLVPNAEHLVFNYLESETDKRCCIMPSNEELNLHQLKTLQFVESHKDFLAVFNRLPAGVLRELCIENADLHELNVLFKRQTNIKKLTISGHYSYILDELSIADSFDEYVKLESLELYQIHCKILIATILSKQTKLKTLKVLESTVDDSLLNVVTNQLTELETLSINVSEITVAAFVNIKKLKKLKVLALQNYYDEDLALFESIANLNHPGITTLDIHSLFKMSVDLIHALAESVPNLKVFRLNCLHCDFMTFNVLLRNFNFVEVLHFESWGQHNDNINLIQGDCFNPKLIELNLRCRLLYETSFLEKLIVAYPSLKKLVMRSWPPLSAPQFHLILNGFTKMESLSLIEGASKLTIDDLDCLKDHKNKLKFISLRDLKVTFTAEIKKKLSTSFEVINVEKGLAMAVDRNSMKCERQ